MARGRGTKPKKAETKKTGNEPAQPTAEQMAAGNFVLEDVTDKRNGGGTIAIGKAYRRRPMIDMLKDRKILDYEQHKALKHYRHHADMADRSPIRDSLCITRGGSGDGPGIEVLNACRVRDDCERAAGSLVDILRAVVVDDMSLSQWAMNKFGALHEKEEKKDATGIVISTVYRLKPRDKALEIAKLEIVMVAKRVMAEIDAGHGTIFPLRSLAR